MKSIKVYLIVVSVLLSVGIGCGIYVWVVLQRLDADGNGGRIQDAPVHSDNTEATATSPE